MVIDIKKLFVKMLKRIALKPTQLYNTRTTATTVGEAWEYHTHAFLADWDVIMIRFCAHEHVEVLWFVRGDTLERSLTDWPSAGKFRGTIYVDWVNNRIGIRAIEAGNGSTAQANLVWYQTILGVVPAG